MKPDHNQIAESLLVQPWLNQSFSSIVGHERTVAALLAHVRERDHGTGIILHGPPGIGKRTLARLYARAALCETPTDGGEACRICVECRSFVGSAPFGYIEIDAAKQGSQQSMRTLKSRLDQKTFADRKVLVVVNADNLTADAFDVLLKTLEEPKIPTAFVLLATSLRKVRPAGRSRCQLHRLSPLNFRAAREYLRAILASAGQKIDEQVLDVLVALSEGRIGRLHSHLAEVRTLPNVTLATARHLFDLDWVQGVAGFWRAALSFDEPAADALTPPSEGGSREAQRRIQAVLLELGLSDDDTIPQRTDCTEAALLHQPEIFAELRALLEQRATILGLSKPTLWQYLARHWLKDDHCDIEGLRLAGLATRDIVARNA